jgi:hypothetical protein
MLRASPESVAIEGTGQKVGEYRRADGLEIDPPTVFIENDDVS